MQTHPLSQHRAQIMSVAQQSGITYLGLFGSYARGEQTNTSDIDLLVIFSKRYSLFDLLRIERKFSTILKAPVDLIPADSLNKYVKPYVQKDLITLYGQR